MTVSSRSSINEVQKGLGMGNKEREKFKGAGLGLRLHTLLGWPSETTIPQEAELGGGG